MNDCKMNDNSTLKPGHIQGETGIWEMVIGLEIHAQISSKSKLFLACYQLLMSSVWNKQLKQDWH